MKSKYLDKDEYPVNRLPKSAKSNIHLGRYSPYLVSILMNIEDGGDPWILLDHLIVTNSMLEKAFDDCVKTLTIARTNAGAIQGECLDETNPKRRNKESVHEAKKMNTIDKRPGKSLSEEKNESNKPGSKMDLLEAHNKDYVIDVNKTLFDGAEPLEISATLSELYQAYVLEQARKGIYLPAHFDDIGKHMKLITDFLRHMHPLGEQDISNEE